MSSWEEQIEKDLSWREAEMGSLKLLLAAAPKGSDRQKALLRACSAMLYAHYEGFSKFCWTILLETIQKENLQRRDLVTPLAKLAMDRVFRTLRGDTSIESVWAFCTKKFEAELLEIASFPDEVDTESNLWPEVSEKINGTVGLNCTLLSVHSDKISQLVGRRNGVAHGEKMEISDIEQFQALEHSAVLVMHELAISVVTCLDRRDYLKPAEDPASAI
jgi:hypothetical protein